MRAVTRVDSGRSEERRGQVLILIAFSIVVLLLIAGLVLDAGVWLVSQRGMRNAADSAAEAGVSELARRPITAGKQLNASTHAMEVLNRQLKLGIADKDLVSAATHALLDADGFGAEDKVPGYAGADRFIIRTPVTGDVSCTGASWGDRALTVRIYHAAPRFMTGLIFQGDQQVHVCATSNIDGNAWVVAVLKPNSGFLPNSATKTMNLTGNNGTVTVCGGDVGINSMLSVSGRNAYLKFLKPTSNPACAIDQNNQALMTIENPSPPQWSSAPPQVRVEGATPAQQDDQYQAPAHLPSYIQIPTWGAAEYAALNDGGAPLLRMTGATAGNGKCSPPKGAGQWDAIAPGKYTLIQASNGKNRWLCPGVYHFVVGGNPTGLQLGQSATIAGQGVTLVFETGPNHNKDDTPLSLSSGASLLLNSPDAGGTTQPAPWNTDDPDHSVPISIWIKPSAGCPVTPIPSCSSSSVFKSVAGSGLGLRGIIFGPTDDMKIAGNNQHHGSGEIWAWTIDYLGNSQLDMVFEGTDDTGYPLIVE